MRSVSPMRSLRPLSTILAWLPSISCGQPEPRDEPFSLALVATSEAPLSEIPYVTLVSEDIACVIESFEVRVHCIHRNGTEVGVFGRSGEGPGEFRTPLFLVRGPDETLGVVDIASNRMSIFETDGGMDVSSETSWNCFHAGLRRFFVDFGWHLVPTGWRRSWSCFLARRAGHRFGRSLVGKSLPQWIADGFRMRTHPYGWPHGRRGLARSQLRVPCLQRASDSLQGP